MQIIQSDIESISQFIIDTLREKGIDLKENARQILIGKAIRSFKEGGLRYMRESIQWEITMLQEMERPFDRTIVISHIDDMTSVKLKDCNDYATKLGRKIVRRNDHYEIVVPKSYDTASVKERFKRIMRGIID